LPDHILLSHFYHGLSKEAAFHLDYLLEAHSHTYPLARGKPFYRKSLKTPLTQAFMMSFPKKRKKSSPALNQKVRNQFLDEKRKF
jgi:hypothetical protein